MYAPVPFNHFYWPQLKMNELDITKCSHAICIAQQNTEHDKMAVNSMMEDECIKQQSFRGTVI
jgi:hypothetical protein